MADDSFEVGKEEYSLYRPTCELMMWKSCVTVQLLLLFYIMHLFIYCTVSYSIFIPVWLDHVPVPNFFVFQQLFIPVMIVLASVSENFPVYMIMCILVGTSVATLFLLPWCVKPKPRSVYCSQLYSSLSKQGHELLNSSASCTSFTTSIRALLNGLNGSCLDLINKNVVCILKNHPVKDF